MTERNINLQISTFMDLSQLLYHTEHRTGALININALHPAFYSADVLELAPEQHVHRGPFCEFAKRHSRGSSKACFQNKERSRSIARGGVRFCGTCPHGVWELAQPVMVEGELAATIYLGHFGTDNLSLTIGDGEYRGPALPAPPADPRALEQSAEFIARFICIEIEMWLSSGVSLGKQKPGSFYRDFCLQYIERNYGENIQLTDLADALKMTPNYVSQKIRHECDKTFSQLLNEKRLQVACTYLEFEPATSITDIAYMCGYHDSNYFSTVFRKHFGQSPRTYRQKHQ